MHKSDQNQKEETIQFFSRQIKSPAAVTTTPPLQFRSISVVRFVTGMFNFTSTHFTHYFVFLPAQETFKSTYC
ncbi:hypothetical protein QVD17_29162 [Tagetes erecta]|uniref:Uncharacterized protein n=1 Tax=Tagetes erecta TaxID=13708 RepID=A0AAD8KBK4_TARER|nr:hypothetical protein QVD17_29162 [Tagetes erecta]